MKAPDDIDDKVLVLMADIFPTGYFAAQNAFKDLTKSQIEDSTVVVIGCGPVGKIPTGHLVVGQQAMTSERRPLRPHRHGDI